MATTMQDAEQKARIIEMVSNAEARMAEQLKARRDYELAPLQLLITGIGVGAALMGAATALASILP